MNEELRGKRMTVLIDTPAALDDIVTILEEAGGSVGVRDLWTNSRLAKYSGEEVREAISDAMTHQRITLGEVATRYVLLHQR